MDLPVWGPRCGGGDMPCAQAPRPHPQLPREEVGPRREGEWGPHLPPSLTHLRAPEPTGRPLHRELFLPNPPQPKHHDKGGAVSARYTLNTCTEVCKCMPSPSVPHAILQCPCAQQPGQKAVQRSAAPPPAGTQRRFLVASQCCLWLQSMLAFFLLQWDCHSLCSWVSRSPLNW